MNPKLNFVFARRSVREFQKREVTDEAIQDLLEAGMSAPSAMCKDPWHFIVLRQRQTLAEIADRLPNGKLVAQAPVGLVVCGDLQKAHSSELSYMLQDCSAAIENVLLAACCLGLGACWLGVHPREERVAHLRRILGLPAHIIPICVIAVGWPAEQPVPRTRFHHAAVHHEKW